MSAPTRARSPTSFYRLTTSPGPLSPSGSRRLSFKMIESTTGFCSFSYPHQLAGFGVGFDRLCLPLPHDQHLLDFHAQLQQGLPTLSSPTPPYSSLLKGSPAPCSLPSPLLGHLLPYNFHFLRLPIEFKWPNVSVSRSDSESTLSASPLRNCLLLSSALHLLPFLGFYLPACPPSANTANLVCYNGTWIFNSSAPITTRTASNALPSFLLLAVGPASSLLPHLDRPQRASSCYFIAPSRRRRFNSQLGAHGYRSSCRRSACLEYFFSLPPGNLSLIGGAYLTFFLNNTSTAPLVVSGLCTLSGVYNISLSYLPAGNYTISLASCSQGFQGSFTKIVVAPRPVNQQHIRRRPRDRRC